MLGINVIVYHHPALGRRSRHWRNVVIEIGERSFDGFVGFEKPEELENLVNLKDIRIHAGKLEITAVIAQFLELADKNAPRRAGTCSCSLAVLWSR